MQIPKTDNLDYQHAFKRGYRLGLEGKSLQSMPNTFRQDLHKRDYFQQGWDQAKEDLIQSDMLGSPTCWRCRLTWITIMILGGIATSYLIIHKYEVEQTELALNQQTLTDQAPSEPLSLLSDSARADLTQHKLEQLETPAPLPALETIIDSDIKIVQAILSTSIENRVPTQILTEQIPKYIREIYFYTLIKNANEQVLYHRWRFNNRYLATIPQAVKDDHYGTWSSKKMSSAWQGKWDIEVLNSQKEVIYRKTFIYGKQL